LFTHQRLQGADNDAHTFSKDGRQLKAEGLSKTCEADHEYRLSTQSRLDYGQFAIPETFQPEKA
jgi:hypothetical protein